MHSAGLHDGFPSAQSIMAGSLESRAAAVQRQLSEATGQLRALLAQAGAPVQSHAAAPAHAPARSRTAVLQPQAPVQSRAAALPVQAPVQQAAALPVRAKRARVARAAHDQAAGGPVEPLMTMAEEMLLAIGEGRLSVASAARIAAARCREPGADEAAQALAACSGKMGERKLHNWVARQPWRKLMPEPYTFEAPMLVRGQQVTGQMACLLPHEVMHSLAAAPAVFAEIFGDSAELEQFWGKIAACPDTPRGRAHAEWLHRHPAVPAAPPARRVPIGIHGDMGEMRGAEKVLVLSWGGLARKGSTLDTRLLFCVLKGSECVPDWYHTWFAAFEVWRWSLQVMTSGVHPAVDHAGRPFVDEHRRTKAHQPIQGGFVGAWAELRGDWEFLRDALLLPHHFNAANVCHLCGATKAGELNFAADFRRGALHRDALRVDEEQFAPAGVGPQQRRSRQAVPTSPLTRIPGFSLWRCNFDLMHALELGLLQRIAPAVLEPLLKDRTCSVFRGGSIAARCRSATSAYRAWSAGRNVQPRVKAITPSWLKPRQLRGPLQLSQKHAKAAALRHMLPWLLSVSEEIAHVSEEAALRAELLRELHAMDQVWAQAPRFLTPSQESAAAGHCEQALEALRRLAEMLPGRWRVVPKAHALTHIAYDSCMGNPRAAHCYQDEDFVGRVKRIWGSAYWAGFWAVLFLS